MRMDQIDPMDQMDKSGAPRYTPRVCGAAVWFGSGDRFTGRLRGQIDGNGGVRVAWV